MAGGRIQVKSFWLPGLAILLCGFMLLEAGRQFGNDIRFSAVQAELGFRGRESYQPSSSTIKETTAAIDTLLAMRPHHPDYLAARANDLAWQAYWSTRRSDAAALLQQAVANQTLAVAARPARPQDRRKLLEYQQLAKQVQ